MYTYISVYYGLKFLFLPWLKKSSYKYDVEAWEDQFLFYAIWGNDGWLRELNYFLWNAQ